MLVEVSSFGILLSDQIQEWLIEALKLACYLAAGDLGLQILPGLLKIELLFRLVLDRIKDELALQAVTLLLILKILIDAALFSLHTF